jgi:hypothetical protein
VYPFEIDVTVKVGVTPFNSFVFSATLKATPESRLSKESADVKSPEKDVKYCPNVLYSSSLVIKIV